MFHLQKFIPGHTVIEDGKRIMATYFPLKVFFLLFIFFRHIVEKSAGLLSRKVNRILLFTQEDTSGNVYIRIFTAKDLKIFPDLML